MQSPTIQSPTRARFTASMPVLRQGLGVSPSNRAVPAVIAIVAVASLGAAGFVSNSQAADARVANRLTDAQVAAMDLSELAAVLTPLRRLAGRLGSLGASR